MKRWLKALVFKSDVLLDLVNRLVFYRVHRRFPARPPVSFNDHVFTVKSRQLRDPLRVFVSDKELVKLYVKAVAGAAHNVPTIAVLRSAAELRRFFATPAGRRLAIKPTHMSGEFLMLDGMPSSDQLARMERWLQTSYFARTGEANYRTLQPKVIVEAFVDFDGDGLPNDYKLYCTHGQVRMIAVDRGRFSAQHSRSLYSPCWRLLPFTVDATLVAHIARPANLAAMIALAEALSQPFDLMRVDLFSDGHRILVGELTNTPGNAAGTFYPDRRADDLVGRVFSTPGLDIASATAGFAAGDRDGQPFRPAPANASLPVPTCR